MIDAEQFNRIEDLVTKSINDLRENIIELMVMRIMAIDYDTLIESNRLLAYKLQSSGMLLDDVIKEVAKRTGKSRETVKKIFEDSYVQSVKYDNSIYSKYGIEPLAYTLSLQMLETLNEAMRQTNGELKNITRTLANSTQNVYTNLLDEAYMKVRSGAFSYEQAITEAITAAGNECAYIHYPSGHKDRIEVATRRAVLCGVNQSSIRSAVERCRERGWNHMCVSSHLGARTYQEGKPPYADHSAWQGKVYWLDKPDGVHESFIEVCGWGHGDGIGGWGCRHSAFAWTEGMGNPFEQYDPEENRERYELVSKQRAKERRIRDTKIQLTGLRKAMEQTDNEVLRDNLQAQYDKKALKLQEYDKDYSDFCKENKLNPYQERLKTAEWSAKESRRAVVAANREAKVKSLNKAVAESPEHGTIKTANEEKVIDVHTVGKIDKDIYKCITEKIRTDEVIITDERIGHIIERRGSEFYDKYHLIFGNILKDPDYIFKDKHENSALVCKRIEEDKKYVNIVLRIAVETDNPEYKNSILTAIGEGERRFYQRLKNNEPLYKKE